MSSKSKKTIIEGWLKKKKNDSSLKLLGGQVKRWFALDIVNATFTYSNGKNKKVNKVIPLRDIMDLQVEQDPEGVGAKEWQYAFSVITKDRPFTLIAPTKAEKEMWVHAFNTILKYKRKAEEIKKNSK